MRTLQELCEAVLDPRRGYADLALLETAHEEMGSVLFFMGEPAAALSALGAMYCPQHRRSLTFDTGYEPAVVSLLSCRLGAVDAWVSGSRPHDGREALALARELSHPHSVVFALQYSALLHQARREVPLVQELAEAVMALSIEQGFTYWLAGGRHLLGWALVEQGQVEEGIAELHQGLATWQATGAELGLTHILARLAEAYKQGGQAKRGLSVLDQALAAVNERGERHYEAEIYRLKGELSLLQAMGAER